MDGRCYGAHAALPNSYTACRPEYWIFPYVQLKTKKLLINYVHVKHSETLSVGRSKVTRTQVTWVPHI